MLQRILPLLFLCFYYISPAQYAMNLGVTKSPARSVTQKIGYTTVEVKYSSPSVKGRTIWGDLVSFNEVWRAGANYATTIDFSEVVNINGQEVPKGTYAFFVIPNAEKAWTLILNKTYEQWGRFNYDAMDDLLRIEVVPEVNSFQENLVYNIVGDHAEKGTITLAWDKILLRLPFETNLKASLTGQLNRNLEKAKPNNAWVNYLQAAEILLNENKALDTALDWINESEKKSTVLMEWDERFYPKEYIIGHLWWTKAKILMALDQKKAAKIYVEKLTHSKEQPFYKKKKESIEAELKQWRGE